MENILLTVPQLNNLLETAAKNGAMRALCAAGVAKERVKQAEAYRLYGRRTVAQWVKRRMVKRNTDGVTRTVWYSRSELNLASDLEARNNNWLKKI